MCDCRAGVGNMETVGSNPQSTQIHGHLESLSVCGCSVLDKDRRSSWRECLIVCLHSRWILTPQNQGTKWHSTASIEKNTHNNVLPSSQLPLHLKGDFRATGCEWETRASPEKYRCFLGWAQNTLCREMVQGSSRLRLLPSRGRSGSEGFRKSPH